MKYLGIDYGKNKIGLALSEGELATAWKVLDINGLEDALTQVKKVISEEGIERVVIGQPESGEALKLVENFLKKLEGVEVIKHPETLTTKNAKQAMIDAGISRKGRQKEDAYAAAIILQDYLDSIM